MNSELYEFLEIWHTEILKNESRTLQIFEILVYRNFKKMNQNFTNFWKFGVWEFKKNESGTLQIFENFGYGNFKK